MTSLRDLGDNVFRDMQEGVGKHALTKLGYRLMDIGHLEEAFKLGRIIRSIKLLHDLAFYAEKEGFIGLASVAKHMGESSWTSIVCQCMMSLRR
jgi:hypothetical protein